MNEGLPPKLRSETRALHMKVEKEIGILEVATLEGYVNLLRFFLLFYEPLEQMIHSQLSALAKSADFSFHSRTVFLKKDLHDLNMSFLKFIPSHVPQFADIANASLALGALYVLEGSALGGQIISSHFSKTLGIQPARGGSFFYGEGPKTGARWREFQSFLVHWTSPKQERSVIEGANLTFQALLSWSNTFKSQLVPTPRSDARS